jgi:hypothetical protein
MYPNSAGFLFSYKAQKKWKAESQPIDYDTPAITASDYVAGKARTEGNTPGAGWMNCIEVGAT